MSTAGAIDFYRDKRLLVTGATGFLASNLVGTLADTRCSIRRWSRQDASLMKVSGAVSVEDMTGDITNAETWERALKDIDIVFQFAAQTSVYAAADDSVADLNANVLPVLLLLETCRRRNMHPSVLLAGTVTEAGLTTRLPVDESHPDNPVTVYDLHKLMAENYLKYYAGQGVVQGAILRLANVYGPGPKSSGAERGVLNSMIGRALAGETLTIYGQGNYLRDYIYVQDVVHAFLAAGAGMGRLNGRHYVIGSGVGHTVAEAVNMIAKRVGGKVGHAVPVSHVDPPCGLSPIEERNFVADIKNFSAATGWTARTTLVDGIDMTIAYASRGTEAPL